MTLSAVASVRNEPLVDLLDREFDRVSLGGLAGGAAAAVPWRLFRKALYAPLRDFLQRPGKEFRGELLTACYHLGGSKGPLPYELPLVIEALHAGSLIVDDIEDASETRRGAPTLHRLFGVPTALNAGNWLYFWALTLLERAVGPEQHAAAQRLANRVLLECHHGQALDLSVRLGDVSRDELPAVVRAISELKTGSLVGLSAGLGAIAGGASEELVDAATRFGRALGTGLQMLDDLSGIVNERRRDKGHEDLVNGRPTWVWAWLADTQAPEELEALEAMSRAVVDGAAPEPLAERMRRLVGAHGKRRVHDHLDAAFRALSEAAPQGSTLAMLKRELERLERSYV
jgi:geranylgeranyl pyrophosphate synthase